MKARRFFASFTLLLYLSVLFPIHAAIPTLLELRRDSRLSPESLAGNMVDTATGAFIIKKRLGSVRSYLSLDFDISYNSLIQNEGGSSSGDLGFGWTHPYEAYLSEAVDGTVTISMNKHTYLEFNKVGDDYVQVGKGDHYDVLEKKDSGEFEGLWRLRRLDGTAYLFIQRIGILFAILNRNELPILINRDRLEGTNYFYPNLTLKAGDREIRTFHYPTIYNLSSDGDDSVVSLHKIQYIEHGAATTYLRYDNKRRLSRVYDPVQMEMIADIEVEKTIPDFNKDSPLEYSFEVTASQVNRLIRVQPKIEHGDYIWLKIVLVSPDGRQSIIHAGEHGSDTGRLFVPTFTGETKGTWKLLVSDSKADGISGKIKGIELESSTTPFQYVRYVYDDENRIVRAFKASPGVGKILFTNVYDANGRVVLQGDGRDDTRLKEFQYKEIGSGAALETTVANQAANGAGAIYRHDDSFRLTYFRDELGNETKFAYDPTTGDRTSITDARGNSTHFGYDSKGYLTSVEEPNANTTHFYYDEYPRVSVDQIPNLNGYDLQLIAIEKFDELPSEGTSIVIVFKDANEDFGIRIFDNTGKKIADRLGEKLKQGELVTLKASLTPFPSDANLTEQQKSGIIANAAAALPSTFDSGEVGNLTGIEDKLGQRSVFKYNEFNALEEVENEAGNTQWKFYDQKGNQTGILNKSGDGVAYSFANGQIVSAAPLLTEEERGDGKQPERIEYDSAGRVVKVIDSANVESTIVYDAIGNVIERRNGLGHSIRFEYDYLNQLVAKTDPEGNVTRFEYDGNGNLSRSIDPLLNSVSFKYDEEDRLIQVTDEAGRKTSREYDLSGRLSVVVDPLGNRNAYTYDEAGNRTGVYFNGNLVSKASYDNRSLPITQMDAKGNTTTFEYDSLGRLVAITDPKGKTTQFAYNEVGHVNQVIDPLLRTMTKAYFEDDTIRSVSDSSGRVTSFEYTTKNNVRKVKTATGETNFKYTPNDFVSQYTPPSGLKAQKYEYNEVNRLVRTSFFGAGLSEPDRVYSYDKNGNKVSIGTQFSTASVETKITRAYDELDRRILNVDAAGNIVRHEYNEVGLVSKIVYPGEREVAYEYDFGNRLKTITDWLGGVTEYTWTGLGQIESILFPNGTKRVMRYDEEDRLESRYDYDAQGEVIVGFEYSYDQSGFVTSERIDGDVVPYQPETMSFVYGDDNRLIEKDGVPVNYDADGNVTSGPIDGDASSLSWNVQNNLSKFEDSENVETVYHYDVEDRLVGWDIEGGESVSLAVVGSAGGSQILVSDSSSRGETEYIYGVGLAYEIRDDQVRVYHYDERGNTVGFSNSAGSKSGTIAYSPFGEIINETGDTFALFKYSGLFGVVSAENKLNYMRFRWYSPEMKRFVSMDSELGDIGNSISLNRYLYAANNPINYVDPEGEFPFLVIGIIVGAAVAGAAIAVGVEAVSAELENRPHKWENYAAAAIGGFVAGGIAGIGVATGGGFAAVSISAAIGGGLGAGGEELLKVVFAKEEIDWEQVGFAAGIGFAAGGILGAAGKAGSDKIAKRLARKSLGRLASATKKLPSRAFKPLRVLGSSKSLGRSGAVFAGQSFSRLGRGARAATKLLLENATGFASGVGENTAGNALFPDDDAGSKTETGNKPSLTAPLVNVGTGGEYEHYQIYLEALVSAGRPVPNPALNLSSF